MNVCYIENEETLFIRSINILIEGVFKELNINKGENVNEDFRYKIPTA